jgi:hypothetical protein
MKNKIYLFLLVLLALTADCGLLIVDLYAQSQNSMSYDATTSPYFYVGDDSSARLGVGIPQKNNIPLPFTLGDSLGMGSQSYIAGWLAGAGWRLEADSNKDYRLTVDDITVRGTLSVYELLLNQIRATNGNLLVTSAANVDSVAKDQASFWTVDVTEHNITPFAPGDIIICQGTSIAGVTFDSTGTIVDDGYLVKRLIYKVDSTSGRRVYISAAPGAPTQKGNIRPGDLFCRIGSATDGNRMGTIGLFADDAGAPYMRVTDSVKSWGDWGNIGSVRMQAGKLNGIIDPDFGGQLEGYGLYATNAYLKGKIIVTNPEDFDLDINLLWDSVSNKPSLFDPPAGAGLFLDANRMGYYNSTQYPASPWRTYMDNTGKFYLTGKGTHYLSWNDSVLNINGNVTLTNTMPYTKVDGLGSLATKSSLGLDEVGDGATYARVLKTDISAGHIKLSEAIGTLDDIDNGTYAKVLATDISAGHIKITGSDGTTTCIDGGKIVANSIDGNHIKAGSILTSKLAFSAATNQNVIAYINASNEGLDITGDRIQINGTTTFAAGYDPSTKTTAGEVTTIVGNTITTGYVNALNVTANSVNSAWVYAGNISANQINAGTLNASTVAVTNLNASNITTGTLSAARINSLGNITATGTISGGTLSGSTITGATISGTTITGGTVQTSASGQRVIMGSSNDLNFYNSSNNLSGSIKGSYTSPYSRLDIDASQDLYLSGGSNTNIVATYGVGITAGTYLDIYATGARINGTAISLSGHTHGAADITSGTIGTARLGSGTASNSTYLRGDGAWSTISAGNAATTTLWVASSSGGAATTQLKIRTITLNGTTFNVLVP